MWFTLFHAQISVSSPSPKGTINNLLHGLGTIDLCLPVAYANLYVFPCLEIGCIQVLPDIVKALVDGVQDKQKVTRRTGSRTCDI